METRDGRQLGWWLAALAGIGVSGCSAAYEDEATTKGEPFAELDAAGDRSPESNAAESEARGRPKDALSPPAGVSLNELPALATLRFEDGNELAIREFASGVLVTEKGILGRAPHYRQQQTWSQLFRELAPEVEVPAALLERDKLRARLGQYRRSEAGGLPPSSRVPQLEGDDDVRETGEFEQASGLFPAENFIAQACRLPQGALALPRTASTFPYVRTNLTSAETQSFRSTYTSYHAVAADRGDVVAHLTSAISGFEGDVFADVPEGSFSINSFAADVFERGECLDFIFFDSCSPNFIFQEQGLVVQGVEQVSSTDRYHHCGYMSSDAAPFF